jgi:hypothetical protein
MGSEVLHKEENEMSMRKPEEKSWSTEKEINFLSEAKQFTIGHSHYSTKDLSRKEMLSRYLEGAKKRTDWSGMDKHAIIAHVHQLLAELK